MKICCILLFLFTTAALYAENPKANKRPNVLFISIDDLNDWIGCLGGHPQVKTPNIDKLAREGVLFTRAYTAATACLPSRAAALTGVAPYTSGCYENKGDQQWAPILKPMSDTLPGHFKNNGYYTSGAGKIFHHFQNDPDSWHDYYPTKRLQFPEYIDPTAEDLTKFRGKEGVPKWWYGEFKWGPLNMTEKNTGDNYSVQFILDELKRQKSDKPFFLTCGIYRPHVPWFAPKKYFDMYPIDTIQLPPRNPNGFDDIPGKKKEGPYYKVLSKYKSHKGAVQAYLASISYMDALIGRLLRGLENSPHADNTIVVFWSDHGWHLGEKSRYRKFHLWEESCRVPMIFKLPKSLEENYVKGQHCNRVVSLIDMVPTLVDLCKLPKPRQNFDGKSLVPLLKNPELETNRSVISMYGRNNYSLRTEQYRYIRYENGDEELYDHDTDPYEWNNLAGLEAYLKIKANLKKRLPKKSRPTQKTEMFNWATYQKENMQPEMLEKAYKRVKPQWDEPSVTSGK